MTWTLVPVAVLRWTWNQANREATFPWCPSSNMILGTQTSNATLLIRMLQSINKHSSTRNTWMISQWGSRRRKRSIKSKTECGRRIAAYKPSSRLSSNACTRMKSRTPTKVSWTVSWTNKGWTSRLSLLRRLTWRDKINKGKNCRDSRIAKCAKWRWCNKMSTEMSSMDKKLREVLDFKRSLETCPDTSSKASCEQDNTHLVTVTENLTKARALVSS